MTPPPAPQPPKRREDLPLNASERAFVIALAKWKAKMDFDEWCRRLPSDHSRDSTPRRGIRTIDLSKADYCDDAVSNS